MEAKYILKYSDFPTQKVLNRIDVNEKEISEAFTQRKLLQQGYQSELKTFFKPLLESQAEVTKEIKKISESIVSSLENKLVDVRDKIEELRKSQVGATQESTDILNQSINKLRDQHTQIVSILDSIQKSPDVKDAVFLINNRPNVKRWLTGEAVELDESDEDAARVINRLSQDKLDIVKAYVKLEAEEGLPGYRKEGFVLHDQDIENYTRTKEFISRLELSSLRENIGFNNMNPEGTITINRIPVYFSDSEIRVKDKTYPATLELLSVLTFPRSTAELTKEDARNYIDILEDGSFRFTDYRDEILKKSKKTQKLVDALHKLDALDKYYPGVMLEYQSKSTVHNIRQSTEKYLAAEEVLEKMNSEKKKFNLNSPLDKDFIESNWDRWRNEIVNILTDRQKNSEFIAYLSARSRERKGVGTVFLSSDENVLINELNRLLGSFTAGNNNIFNEIAAIADELRRKGILSIDHVKKIYRFLTTK